MQEARRLFTLGQEASIVGDHRAARDLFRQAQELNGADERISYYLARSNEELKATNDAVAQYCRYLVLAPTGSDAADVRSRLDRLTEPASTRAGIPAGRRTAAAARFQSAVEAADRGQLGEAERRFGEVIGQLPSAAEAYYNRALVRARGRDWGGAERDLQKYLSLRSDAEDAAAVRERIRLLRGAASSPSTALAGGVVLPGFGQFYTRRPLFGAAVLAAAAGGVFYGMREEQRSITVQDTTPFGQPYTYTKEVSERPNQTVGYAAAGAVILASAFEAFSHARQRRSEAARFASSDSRAAPSDSRVALWATPVVSPATPGVAGGLGMAAGGRVSF